MDELAKLDNFRQIIKDCFPPFVRSYDDLFKYIRLYILKPSVVQRVNFKWPEDLSSVMVCIYECYDISGWSISELPEAKSISEDTLLLASNLTSGGPQSVNVKYSQLSTQLAEDIKTRLYDDGLLHQMAYETEEHFALADHNHDDLYTADVWVEDSQFILDYQRDHPDEISVLGKLHVTKQLSPPSEESPAGEIDYKAYEIKCPHIVFPPIAFHEYPIGALKFIPTKSLRTLFEGKLYSYKGKPNINIYDDDFNGWVFPNGTTFTCEAGEFPYAMQYYGKAGSSTSFQVPDLTNLFLKGTTPLHREAMPPMQFNNAKVVIGPHTHGVWITDVTGNVTVKNAVASGLKVVSTDPSDKLNDGNSSAELPSVAFFSMGEEGSLTLAKDLVATVTMRTDDEIPVSLQTAPNDNSSMQYQPACYLMPVMMYIGAKNYNTVEQS